MGDDANWKCVDEAGAHDGLTTYVYSHSGLSSSMDTYATEDHTTGTGTINSITVHYVISKTGDTPTLAGAALIRTHSTLYWGTFYDATASWVEHTHTWTDNPFTSSAWTWQEIDDLEIGVELDIGTQEDDDVRCTQIWVVVDYTPGPEVGTYDSDYSTPKDTYSLTETVYAKATGLESQSGWLGDWDKRVELTIDSNDIDSDLSNFPILVYLSTSSGRNNDDVSFVFDELQSDANRRKIAVTKDDGTTECYVEIEDWDDASEEAWLWVKVSGTNSISSSTDTDLYLYYDSSQADNTAYVGDSGSRTEVWDSNFVGVWHLGESSGTRYDSTSNDNDLAPSGTVGASSSGRIGTAASFAISPEGSLYIADNAALSITGDLTISGWMNMATLPSAGGDEMTIVAKWDTDEQSYHLRISDTSPPDGSKAHISSNGTNDFDAEGGTTLSTSTWYYVTLVNDDTEFRLYLNDFFDTSSDNPESHGLGIYDGTAAFHIGRQTDLSDEMNGRIDEVRVSNTDRNAAWIKASHESGRDHLVDFGSEENGPLYDFKYYSDWSGSPTEEGSELDVGENPSGEWRSSYTLQGTDPTGTWGVRVYDAGTSNLRCSCSFTVQAVPEFPYGVMAAAVACFTIYLAKRNRARIGVKAS